MNNIKALITTLVLGSSTMASADSFTVSGSVSVRLGARTTARPLPRPVVVQDPCAPVVSAPYRPATSQVYTPAISTLPYFNPRNTVAYGQGMLYQGWLGSSAIKVKPNSAANWHYASNRVATQNWFDLTQPTRIDNSREYFYLGADKGLFNMIKLDNLGARGSRIDSIRVDYADGISEGKTFKLNQILDRNHPTITIDLDGDFRVIERIVVFGATDAGAAFKLQAK